MGGRKEGVLRGVVVINVSKVETVAILLEQRQQISADLEQGLHSEEIHPQISFLHSRQVVFLEIYQIFYLSIIRIS